MPKPNLEISAGPYSEAKIESVLTPFASLLLTRLANDLAPETCLAELRTNGIQVTSSASLTLDRQGWHRPTC